MSFLKTRVWDLFFVNVFCITFTRKVHLYRNLRNDRFYQYVKQDIQGNIFFNSCYSSDDLNLIRHSLFYWATHEMRAIQKKMNMLRGKIAIDAKFFTIKYNLVLHHYVLFDSETYPQSGAGCHLLNATLLKNVFNIFLKIF